MTGPANPEPAELTQSLEASLADRAKELGCLRALSRLIDTRGISVTEILRRSVDLLPPGFRYPDAIRARIVVDGDEFAAAGYLDTPWKLSRDIRPSDRVVGSLEVCYLDEKPDADQGPFAAEEVYVVEAFTERLERLIERQRAAARLRADREKLETLWQIASIPDADTGAIADHVLESMIALTGSAYGFYGSVDEGGSVAVLHSWAGDITAEGSPRELHRTIPLTQAGVWTEAVRRQEPLIVNDYAAVHSAKRGLPGEHELIVNLLLLPVCVGGRVDSIAALANKPSDFDDADVIEMMNFLSAAQAILDRRRAEEGLRDREWRLATILEATGVGTWEWNVQTGETTFNEMWAQLVGYTLGELAPISLATWQGLTHPDDLAHAMELVNRHFSGASPYYECDMRLRHKDGHWVWIQDRGRVITRTEDGKPLVMFGTHTDISERKHAEEALTERNRFIDVVLEHSPIGFAVNTIDDSQALFVSSAFESIYGVEPGSIRSVEDFFEKVYRDPAQREEMRQRIIQDMQSGDPARMRWLGVPIMTRDGEHRFLDSANIPVPDQNLMVSTVQDTTERYRAEAALAHSHDLMTYVIEHNRSAVAVHDRDLNYIYVSQRYLDDYGVKDRDVIGKHHYEVFPDLPEKWRIVHQKALKGEVLSAEDDQYERADGSVEWTRWECRPWYEADGTIGGIIVYTEVVTERKKAENRLIQYQERLRALAAEIVVSGEREQRRLAVELHDGVGQVLAAAKIEAQILACEVHDSPAEERLDRLVRLLAESIDEVRTMTAQLAPTVLLERGLSDALYWLRDRYEELYGLRCEIGIKGDADRQSVETTMLVFRTVREALNNVVRHSRRQDAAVSVERAECGTTVSITDRGIGFDPSAIDEHLAGGGFGLFSIREECLARGGSLEIRSAPGEGTCVTAYILADPEQDDRAE